MDMDQLFEELKTTKLFDMSREKQVAVLQCVIKETLKREIEESYGEIGEEEWKNFFSSISAGPYINKEGKEAYLGVFQYNWDPRAGQDKLDMLYNWAYGSIFIDERYARATFKANWKERAEEGFWNFRGSVIEGQRCKIEGERCEIEGGRCKMFEGRINPGEWRVEIDHISDAIVRTGR